MSSPFLSKDFPDCFYRASAKGLVVNQGKILLLKEAANLGGKWELPGGGINFGESPHEALVREVREEMGVTVKSIGNHPLYIWHWRFDNKNGLDWYYSLVIAYKVELQSLDVKVTEECEAIRFFSPEEVRTINFDCQTDGLKHHFNLADFASS